MFFMYNLLTYTFLYVIFNSVNEERSVINMRYRFTNNYFMCKINHVNFI